MTQARLKSNTAALRLGKHPWLPLCGQFWSVGRMQNRHSCCDVSSYLGKSVFAMLYPACNSTTSHEIACCCVIAHHKCGYALTPCD